MASIDGFTGLGRLIHQAIFGVKKIQEPEWDDTPVEHVLHLRYQTCGSCQGRGKHVNPSVDSHGISAYEFDEDPDFRDDYFSGTYDVTCYECKGERVSLAIDEKRTAPEALKAAEEFFEGEASHRAECEAERRMGA